MTTLAQPALDRAAGLELFAALLDYPGAPQRTALARAPVTLAETSPVLLGLVNNFAARAQAMLPTELEELYAAGFDLQPDWTLNLSHHLFGEDHGKRSAMLIELSAAAQAAGLDLAGELPDHLCWLLRLLARAPGESELQDLVPYVLLPALRSLSQRLPQDHLYEPLFQALYLFLSDAPLELKTNN